MPAAEQNTQQEALQLLSRHKDGLSVVQLCAQLGVTRTAVRQHLQALVGAGLIVEGELRSAPKGRPSRSYRLTDAGINALPKQYAWFSSLLMQGLGKSLGEEAFGKLMQTLGHDVAKQVLEKKGLRRLDATQLAKVMDGLGYDARPQGPDKVEAFNCVYHDVAAQDQRICHFDLALIEGLTGKKPQHLTCMAEGGASCSFKLGKS